MKISIINGSPKDAGISGQIILDLEKILEGQIKKYHAMKLVKNDTPQEVFTDIFNSDILLVVTPIYVDSFPAPLIELLTRLENAAPSASSVPRIFTVISAAFDASQTTSALKMMKHFAERLGMPWGYGIGVGKSGLLFRAGEDWEKELATLATAIKEKGHGENIYYEPKISVFMYRAIINTIFFIEAKRNKAGKVRARPYLEKNI